MKVNTKIWAAILVIAFSTIAAAWFNFPFTPKRDIDLQSRYNIINANHINASKIYADYINITTAGEYDCIVAADGSGSTTNLSECIKTGYNVYIATNITVDAPIEKNVKNLRINSAPDAWILTPNFNEGNILFLFEGERDNTNYALVT